MEEMITNSERPIEVITEEINFYKVTACESIIEIGKRLIEAKALLQHGEWQSWLSEKVEFSETSAQNYMRLAKEYPNPHPVGVLGVSKALKLLALPPVEREEFLNEKHTVNGEEKTVEEMSKRELEKAIADKKEAEKQLEELKQELESAKESEAEADALLVEAKKEIERLKENSNQPNGKAAKLTDEKIAQIKAEEKEKQQKQIDKLNKTISDLEEQKKAAEDVKAALEKEIEDFDKYRREENKALEEEVADLKAKLKMASSSTITEFKLHFEAVQNLINKMADCINEAPDDDTAGKLKSALGQLADKIKEII